MSSKLFNCALVLLLMMGGIMSPSILQAQAPPPQENIETPAKEESASEPSFKLGDEEFQPMSYWKEFFRMMMILGIILGVVLVLAWFLKGFLNQRIQLANVNNTIKVIEKRNLSQKSMLYLVEVHGKQYLIGDSAQGGVEYLVECMPGEAITRSDNDVQFRASKESFMEILQRKLNQKRPSLLKLKK